MSKSAASPGRKIRVYLAHAQEDERIAAHLSQALEDSGDIAIVLASWEGKAEREDLIARSDTVVFALSPASAASRRCLWEYEFAGAINKRIVPVMVQDVSRWDMPPELAVEEYIFFTDRREFASAARELVDIIRTDSAWIQDHTRYAELAEDWEADGGTGALLTGDALESAEDWLASQPDTAPAPTPLHQTFLADCRRHAAGRQRKRLRTAVVFAIISTILLAGTAAGWLLTSGTLIAPGSNQVQAKGESEELLTARRDLARTSSTLEALIAKTALGITALEGASPERAEALLDDLEREVQRLETASGVGDLEQRKVRLQKMLADARADLRERAARGGERDPVAPPGSTVQVLQQDEPPLPATGASDNGTPSASAPPGPDIKNPAVRFKITGDAHRAEGKYTEALAAYQKGISLLEPLAETNPGALNLQGDLADLYSSAGQVMQASSQTSAALQAYATARTIYEDLASGQPDKPEWQRGLSKTYVNTGFAYRAQENLPAALTAFSANLQVLERLATIDPGNAEQQRELALAYENVGNMQFAQGKSSAALASYRKSLPIYERVAKAEPANIRWQADYAESYGKVGILLNGMKRRKEALSAFKRSRKLFAPLAKRKDHARSKRWLARLDRYISAGGK